MMPGEVTVRARRELAAPLGKEGNRMKVRRVVTGHREGKATFVSDEEVQATTVALIPGLENHRLWGGDRAPTFPDAGSPPDQPTYFPPVGGYRFVFVTFPPAGGPVPTDLDVPAALREMDEKLPGLLAHMEPDGGGMHTSDTIDFLVVLSGEITLELDDSAEKVLRPGDTVVQNGTRHRLTNRGKDPAVLAGFIVGAYRSSGSGRP
jgi:quercetin dioxygenase-like cupin family protein